MSAIARRYARAAVEAVLTHGSLADVDRLAATLRSFAQAYRDNVDLQELMQNPVLVVDRERTLHAVLNKLGVIDQGAKLIALLATRDRMSALDEVVLEVESLADDKASRLRAYVTSAVALTEAQAARVAKALEARLKKPVLVVVNVEPALMGGLICRVGDLTFDTSVRRQLKVLAETLLKPSHE